MSPAWFSQGPPEALNRWAKFLLRYVIGGGGLVYEVVIDKLHNPTALVVFGGIAGISDVLGYRATVKRQAEAEAKAVAKAKDEEDQ